MSKVYIVQNSFKRGQNGLEPKFDFSPAEVYGELVELLSPTAKPFEGQKFIICDLHKKLENFSDDDHLLCVGNPTLIGWATAIAAFYNGGKVKTLQWSGMDGEYISSVANLNKDCLLMPEEV